MVNTPAVRNNIRKDDGKQIDSIIETSRQRGMISHIEYAKRLIADRIIAKEQVDWLFDQKNLMKNAKRKSVWHFFRVNLG